MRNKKHDSCLGKKIVAMLVEQAGREVQYYIFYCTHYGSGCRQFREQINSMIRVRRRTSRQCLGSTRDVEYSTTVTGSLNPG